MTTLPVAAPSDPPTLLVIPMPHDGDEEEGVTASDAPSGPHRPVIAVLEIDGDGVYDDPSVWFRDKNRLTYFHKK